MKFPIVLCGLLIVLLSILDDSMAFLGMMAMGSRMSQMRMLGMSRMGRMGGMRAAGMRAGMRGVGMRGPGGMNAVAGGGGGHGTGPGLEAPQELDVGSLYGDNNSK
ncbi:uncharacterized protein [Musca autumnalis]|uniref:uncharacterized protein n=1 Tax=Musca autumnalis TaxID=221902 RepID=UPI003CF522F2